MKRRESNFTNTKEDKYFEIEIDNESHIDCSDVGNLLVSP